MSDKVNKVLAGMEKLANAEGYKLEVWIQRPQEEWLISFRAGTAQVTTRVSSFATVPQIVLEPFCEEMVKQIKDTP